MVFFKSFRTFSIVCVLLLAACNGADVAAPSATVHFVLDAPLCSSIIPVQFSIDGLEVGVDTFRVDIPSPHTTSRAFAVSLGAHTLSARTGAGYAWPDKAVSLAAGQAFADSLSFYCS
jgi:hypothetical protein